LNAQEGEEGAIKDGDLKFTKLLVVIAKDIYDLIVQKSAWH
jgi:hypothetical protein